MGARSTQRRRRQQLQGRDADGFTPVAGSQGGAPRAAGGTAGGGKSDGKGGGGGGNGSRGGGCGLTQADVARLIATAMRKAGHGAIKDARERGIRKVPPSSIDRAAAAAKGGGKGGGGKGTGGKGSATADAAGSPTTRTAGAVAGAAAGGKGGGKSGAGKGSGTGKGGGGKGPKGDGKGGGGGARGAADAPAAASELADLRRQLDVANALLAKKTAGGEEAGAPAAAAGGAAVAPEVDDEAAAKAKRLEDLQATRRAKAEELEYWIGIQAKHRKRLKSKKPADDGEDPEMSDPMAGVYAETIADLRRSHGEVREELEEAKPLERRLAEAKGKVAKLEGGLRDADARLEASNKAFIAAQNQLGADERRVEKTRDLLNEASDAVLELEKEAAVEAAAQAAERGHDVEEDDPEDEEEALEAGFDIFMAGQGANSMDECPDQYKGIFQKRLRRRPAPAVRPPRAVPAPLPEMPKLPALTASQNRAIGLLASHPKAKAAAALPRVPPKAAAPGSGAGQRAEVQATETAGLPANAAAAAAAAAATAAADEEMAGGDDAGHGGQSAEAEGAPDSKKRNTNAAAGL